MANNFQFRNLKYSGSRYLLSGILVISFFLTAGVFTSYSQTKQSLCKRFRELGRPEKRWVILHPFVAKKSLEISLHAVEITARVKNDPLLDGDMAGGQLDAFRHAFWMASLSHEICWRKAYRLGKAHEKGNRIEFKKGKTEEGILPDKASVEMDLFNNKYGVLLGKQLKKISDEELIILIKNSILHGDLKIIKKDHSGNSLDAEGNIIPEKDWNGKWENKRVLVSSDFKRENGQ